MQANAQVADALAKSGINTKPSTTDEQARQERQSKFQSQVATLKAKYPNWNQMTITQRAQLMKDDGILQTSKDDGSDPTSTMKPGTYVLKDGSKRTVGADGSVSYEASEADQQYWENKKAQEREQRKQRAIDEYNSQQDAKYGLIPGTSRGFRDFSKGFVDAATKVVDFAVDKIPGLNLTKDIYKTFAPPGSKFYKEGSIEDKAKGYVKGKVDEAVNQVKGQAEAKAKEYGQQVGKKLLNKALGR